MNRHSDNPAEATRTGLRQSRTRGNGETFVWFTAAGVAVSLLMIGGLLLLITVKGLHQFWPNDLWELRLNSGQRIIGESLERELAPGSQDAPGSMRAHRTRFRVGNQDVFGATYVWITDQAVMSRAKPSDLVAVDRREWGPAYGRIIRLYDHDRIIAEGAAAWTELSSALATARALRERIVRLEQASIDEDDRTNGETLDSLYAEAGRYAIEVELSSGQTLNISLDKVLRALKPNELSSLQKTLVYLQNLWAFLSEEPREANTEGGIFPAIYGTILLVLIMTLAVMPFGVLAAIYLREYARQGLMVRLVRIAVNNLAGVPSIVFGIFGLGFFIYGLGGVLDQTLFHDVLPNPTFGTGGILWASLTLALLTVPVVIVATEEGLASVSRDLREASVALGATKFETLRHVVLPGALPGILTGMILAMARAAGEVAPLMLTGVVKLAPSLPLDAQFPFLHLERKFMHLGFHIYDVGFQSPNVEAAKSMVYMTTLTLIIVVVALNVMTVTIRARLRRRLQSAAV